MILPPPSTKVGLPGDPQLAICTPRLFGLLITMVLFLNVTVGLNGVEQSSNRFPSVKMVAGPRLGGGFASVSTMIQLFSMLSVLVGRREGAGSGKQSSRP